MIPSNQQIRCQLETYAEPAYARFSARLTPGAKILGVRLPTLRRMAKELAAGDWQAYLRGAWNDYLEERLLQAFVLGYAKTDLETLLPYASAFIPKIDNWSVNDSFCGNFRIARQNRPRMLQFLDPYFTSPQEFSVRMAVIMLQNHFLVPEYLDEYFFRMEEARHEGYYAQMGVAWALATAYCRFPQETLTFLQKNSLPVKTHNKTLQKIRESRLVPLTEKELIHTMKRK